MRFLLQYKGRSIGSRGTSEDALAFKAQAFKAAKVAAKKTKEQVVLYFWRVIDTQTGREVK